jgi:hypothetical protein
MSTPIILKVGQRVERTRKESHLDTIWYEIDMLEYCHKTLRDSPPPTTDPSWNLLIEGFLLHFRNLIQFYGGNENRHRRHGNDLSTLQPEVWAGRPLVQNEQQEVDAMRTPGAALDNAFSDKISVCLQHCTVQRAETLTDWDVAQMFADIDNINAVFKKSFPRAPGLVAKVGGGALNAIASSHSSTVSFSTTTVTKLPWD